MPFRRVSDEVGSNSYRNIKKKVFHSSFFSGSSNLINNSQQWNFRLSLIYFTVCLYSYVVEKIHFAAENGDAIWKTLCDLYANFEGKLWITLELILIINSFEIQENSTSLVNERKKRKSFELKTRRSFTLLLLWLPFCISWWRRFNRTSWVISHFKTCSFRLAQEKKEVLL